MSRPNTGISHRIAIADWKNLSTENEEKAALLEGPFPREAFMAMELTNGDLPDVQGQVIYPPAFGI